MDVVTATQEAFTNKNIFAVTEWDDYIGQTKAKKRLQIAIDAAKERNEIIDNVLILGNSGSGKSSIAAMIAKEHNVEFLPILISPNFNMNSLGQALINFDTEVGGGIVFLDEIHNLKAPQQHYLYTILENKAVSYDSGNKYHFENDVTIVAATTDEQMLTDALVGRFEVNIKLDDYTTEEMAQIVERMCISAKVPTDVDTCIALAHASAGLPRQAAKLVKTARDVGVKDIKEVLSLADITEDGLTVDHKDYLLALRELGGTAGIDAITSISMRPRKILEKAERTLIQRKLIERGKGGRSLTKQGLITTQKFITEASNEDS